MIDGGGLTVVGATVKLSGSGGEQIYDGALVTMNSGTFDLNGLSETVGNFTGTGGTVMNSAAR